MTYQSKKNPEITAALDFKQEKYNTVMMIYLTGSVQFCCLYFNEGRFLIVEF